jgi:Cytochrome oxidase complex assembly protein 1
VTTARLVALLGAVYFGAFAVVAFVFQRLDVSQATLSIVGGALAYAFLVSVAVGWLVQRRRAAGVSQRRVARYLMEHPRVAQTLGKPVRVGAPQGDARLGRGAGQANLEVPVRGPMGEATAELVMAKLGQHWEVLSGELVLDGERVSLTGVSGLT